jgi:predicted transcriptional regulator YdeE
LNEFAADIYCSRFRKVLEYIDSHLDDDLTIDRLSTVAAFSKYHFHRQFSELFGISVYKYVRLTRLKRASYQLAFRDRNVTDNSFGVVEKTIPGGRCAVLRYIGDEANLGESIAYLYSNWLPLSGEEPRDFPLFLQRVKFFPDVPEHEAIIDVFLPLK